MISRSRMSSSIRSRGRRRRRRNSRRTRKSNRNRTRRHSMRKRSSRNNLSRRKNRSRRINKINRTGSVGSVEVGAVGAVGAVGTVGPVGSTYNGDDGTQCCGWHHGTIKKVINIKMRRVRIEWDEDCVGEGDVQMSDHKLVNGNWNPKTAKKGWWRNM